MCGGGGMHAWGMVWELGSRCDTSHGRQKAVWAVGAALVISCCFACAHVQVASQPSDVDGTEAVPTSGGDAVLGSMLGAAQVRAEERCLTTRRHVA